MVLLDIFIINCLVTSHQQLKKQYHQCQLIPKSGWEHNVFQLYFSAKDLQEWKVTQTFKFNLYLVLQLIQNDSSEVLFIHDSKSHQ